MQANFARWEPPHGYFRFRHPWSKYQKIGAQSRRCAYLMVALDTCISKTEFKVNIYLNSIQFGGEAAAIKNDNFTIMKSSNLTRIESQGKIFLS